MFKITDDPMREWKINDVGDNCYIVADRFGDIKQIPMYHAYNTFTTLWDSRSFGYYEVHPNLLLWSYSSAADAFAVNVPATSIIRAFASKSGLSGHTVYGAAVFTGAHIRDMTRIITPAPAALSHADAARIAVFYKLAKDEITKESIMNS